MTFLNALTSKLSYDQLALLDVVLFYGFIAFTLIGLFFFILNRCPRLINCFLKISDDVPPYMCKGDVIKMPDNEESYFITKVTHLENDVWEIKCRQLNRWDRLKIWFRRRII